MTDEGRVDCVRDRVGVDGTILMDWPPSRETGRAEEVSSEICLRARLAGAVFSNLSARAGFSAVGSTVVSSFSSKFALDWVLFKVFFAGVTRPG